MHIIDPFFRHMALWSHGPAEKRHERFRERIDAALGIEIPTGIPAEIREMLEIAKGAMAYGFFYRPLASFAGQQLYNIADAATVHRCRQLGLTRTKTFADRIDILVGAGIIPADEKPIWDAKRSLRNSYSHREQQSLDWPPNELASLRILAQDIRRLFADPYGPEAPILRQLSS